MESEFQKIRKEEIKYHRNITLLEIVIYVIAAFILFGLGGKITDLATRQVQLISIDGIIKILAMLSSLIFIAIVFVPGPIVVIRDIATYFYNKD